MVTTLSQLVDMIQGGAVPAWLRSYVLEHKEEIATALRERGMFTLPAGPNGEEVSIRADERAVAAFLFQPKFSKMVGRDALGNGNDHFGEHNENLFCRQRGCVPARPTAKELRS